MTVRRRVMFWVLKLCGMLQIVVHKTSARGTHFRRAGPRQRVYFQSDEVNAAIVTCGGLCPGLNTVIRELVCGLYDMYGVTSVVGMEVRTCPECSSCLFGMCNLQCSS
jgi:hypothetical protein